MKNTVLLASAALLFTGATAFAADTPSRQTCIPLKSIDQSPVVDDSTIVVKLKNNAYKRIDLIAPCSGLDLAGGFNHVTHSNDLCTSTTLHVRGDTGVTCGIRQIVDISADEAKTLTARR